MTKKLTPGEQRAEEEVKRVQLLGDDASTASLLEAAKHTSVVAQRVIKGNKNLLDKIKSELGGENKG